MTDGTRYRQPPYDPTGLAGPRDLGETTPLTEYRYLNGPAMAGLPGYVAVARGPWYASDDGSRWCRIDAPGAVEPDFERIDAEEGDDDA